MPPDHRAECRGGKPRHSAEDCHGHAQSAEGDRSGIEDQDKDKRLKWRVADQNQKRACDGDRGAEARHAFEERPEAKSDDHKDDTAVIRQIACDPVSERVEAARTHRDIVEQKRIQHDPHDRPERENGAIGDRVQGQIGRHLPDGDRDDERDDEPGQRGDPRGQAKKSKKNKHRNNGQHRHEEGQPKAVRDWRQKLAKH